MFDKYKKVRALSLAEMKKDSYYGQFLSHPIATLLVCFIDKTFITPNIITFISLLFTLFGGVAIILLKCTEGLLIAWGLLHIAVVLDSADGQLARWKGISSEFGGYFDGLVDHIKHRVIIISVAIRIMHSEPYALLVALVVLAIHTFAFYENQSRVIIDIKNKEISKKRAEVTQKMLGKSKIKTIIGTMQTLNGYFLVLAVTFIINKPIYLLYFIGINSALLVSKRFLIYSIVSLKKN